MARSLVNKQNVQAPDSDYPYGRIKDDDGSNNGTPVNEDVYGDIHQFFEKMMAESGITPNEQPDNSYSGFQLYQSLLNLFGGLRRSPVQIPAWDMDTNASIIIDLPAGVTRDKIRGISIMIAIDSSDPSYYPFSKGGYYVLSNPVAPENKITLNRDAGGFFDSVSYSSTSQTRGYIVIEWQP